MPMIGSIGRLSRNVVSARITGMFFDRQKVIDRTSELERKILSRFGYLTMRDARQRIRRRKKPSKPGQSPTNWMGLLKAHIYFGYDPGQGVVIGPAQLAGASGSNIPEVLEKGGVVRSRLWGWSASIAARPFMQPAFDRQVERQGDELKRWRDAL